MTVMCNERKGSNKRRDEIQEIISVVMVLDGVGMDDFSHFLSFACKIPLSVWGVIWAVFVVYHL